MKLKKWIASLLAAVVALSTMGVTTLADAAVTGIPENSWSTEALNAAVSNGLLVGDATGHIQPKKDITRAEVVTVIHRAFGAAQGAAPAGVEGWYAADLGKGIHMGIIDANDLRPDASATREEVFSMLGRALQVTGGSGALAKFADGSDVSAKYQAELSAMVSNGYVRGTVDEATGELTLAPQNTITREEFAQVMHSSIHQYLGDSNVTGVISGNAMLRSAGTTLDGVSVDGDLIIGDGVGNGDVTIKDSKISGRVLVRGGGANTIYFENTTVSEVTAAKPDGNVRIKSAGGSIGAVNVAAGTNPVTLSGDIGTVSVTGDNLSVILNAATVSAVSTEGSYASITVEADTTVGAVHLAGDHDHLNVVSGQVDAATTKGEGARVKVDEGAAIGTVTANGSNTVVYGSGEVEKVAVNADNSGVYTGNTDVTVASGIKDTTVGDKKVEAGTAVQTDKAVAPPATIVADSPNQPGSDTKTDDPAKPSGGMSGGGGGGGGGSATPTVSVKDIKVLSAGNFSFTANASISAIKVDGADIPFSFDEIVPPNRPIAVRHGNSGEVVWDVLLDNDNLLNETAKKLEVERSGYKSFTDKNSLRYLLVTGITVTPATLTLTEGGSGANLNAVISPASANNKGINWSSSDTGVATVDGRGSVTPAGVGTATITAETQDGAFTDTCVVTVNPAPSDFTAVTDITGVPATGTIGTPVALAGTVVPTNATYQTILWSLGAGSTAPGAAVNGTSAEATGVGTVVVTATIADGEAVGTNFTKDFAITFENAKITSLSPAVTAPATGNTPVTTAPADSTEATFGSITWGGLSGSTFAANDTPTATFTATAKAGYEFDTATWTVENGTSLVTVAGAASVDIISVSTTAVTLQANYAALPFAPPDISFSFDGTNAGKLMGATTDMEYSVDGGSSYTPCSADIDISGEVITSASGIKVRYTADTASTGVKTIAISDGPGAPSFEVASSLTHKLTGLPQGATNLEVSTDGVNWSALTVNSSGVAAFASTAGDTVSVREKATGTTLAGTPAVKTAADVPDELRGIISITMEKPATGGTPQSSLAPGDGYSSTITWSPTVSGTFAPGVIYTASVVMTADSTHKFAPGTTVSLLNVSVTENQINVDAPGNTLSFKARFIRTAFEVPTTSFSFDGADAGKLMGATTTMEYSVDGGSSYTACTADIDISGEAITSANGIKVRHADDTESTAVQTITINEGPEAPSFAAADSLNSLLTGLPANATNLEASVDDLTWTDITVDSSGEAAFSCSDGDTVSVRVKATGTTLAGTAATQTAAD